MADLSEIQASLAVKIAGSNPSTGVEVNYLQVDASGNAFIVNNNGAGAAAVNVQDGGNSLTVDQGTIPWVVISSAASTDGSNFTFGQVATAGIAQVPVESTTYVSQNTNAQRSVASASANDTSAGTGGRTVTITYLDQTGAGPYTETLTLSGTTGVNTVNTNICFIEKIVVSSVGSNATNVGIITLYSAINKGGTAIGTISASANQTLWAHHYVPTGKTCYISGFSFFNDSTNAGNGALMVLKARNPTSTTSPLIQISDTNGFPGSPSTTTRTYLSRIPVQGPSIITAYVTPYANGAQVQYASFDYIDS